MINSLPGEAFEFNLMPSPLLNIPLPDLKSLSAQAAACMRRVVPSKTQLC
jgi:hypothetical protein